MSNTSNMISPIQFVLDEARLLNDGRYEDWINLFGADGFYWVPLYGDKQQDAENFTSIAYEDRLLLATRVERLKSRRAHSIQPGVKGLHVLQQPVIEIESNLDGECELYTPFLYIEVLAENQRLYGGVWRHKLRPANGSWSIVLKRVDLVNATSAHEAIQLFP